MILKVNSDTDLIVTNERILSRFTNGEYWWSDELTAVKELATLKVDSDDDIKAIMPNGKIYWIITDMRLRKFNKAGRYEIVVHFELKRDSKYSKAIFEWEAK